MTKRRSSRSRSRSRRSNAARSRQKTETVENVDFSQEYRYVVNDLKRFGILAVAMFALLIVLALALG